MRGRDAGVNHVGLCAVAKWKGLDCNESKSFEDLNAWLQQGRVFVCSAQVPRTTIEAS